VCVAVVPLLKIVSGRSTRHGRIRRSDGMAWDGFELRFTRTGLPTAGTGSYKTAEERPHRALIGALARMLRQSQPAIRARP
jgi:hypothetical protein